MSSAAPGHLPGHHDGCGQVQPGGFLPSMARSQARLHAALVACSSHLAVASKRRYVSVADARPLLELQQDRAPLVHAHPSLADCTKHMGMSGNALAVPVAVASGNLRNSRDDPAHQRYPVQSKYDLEVGLGIVHPAQLPTSTMAVVEPQWLSEEGPRVARAQDGEMVVEATPGQAAPDWSRAGGGEGPGSRGRVGGSEQEGGGCRCWGPTHELVPVDVGVQGRQRARPQKSNRHGS